MKPNYVFKITNIFLDFLQIRWEKNITLGEPPGFLHSWWCVFWDLYCAAPERRETCDHSSEAKAFHDYVSDKFNAYYKQSHYIYLQIFLGWFWAGWQ